MKRGRIFLSSIPNLRLGYLVEYRVPYSEVKNSISIHDADIKRLLNITFAGDDVIFKAKPEGFGIILVGKTIIEVMPKFLSSQQEIPFRFVSDLFNVTEGPWKLRTKVVEKDISGELSSAFDWYFFSLLNQIYEFLRKYDRRIMQTKEEEVIGVRGRIKIADTIRKAKGLKHINVCEIQTIEPRKEFLGIIKTLVSTLQGFTTNKSVHALAKKCKSQLISINEIPFNKNNIKKLKLQSKILVSEHRKSGAILKLIFGIFNIIETTIGSLSHHCFSFNMNTQFEILVDRLLKESAKLNFLSLGSGNEKPIKLLNNYCSGLTVSNEEEDQEEFDSNKSIIIKPDAFLLDNSKNVTFTLDAKYKILKHDPLEKIFAGVRSRDIQQVLTYWIHFSTLQTKGLRCGIVYPHPGTQGPETILSKIGVVVLDNPLGRDKLNIEIFAVDILRAVQALSQKNVSESDIQSLFPLRQIKI